MNFMQSAVVEAAVLVLYRGGVDSGELLFTRRSQSMRAHPGEVAFPGGKIEQTDIDVICAALRESREEVGLNVESIAVRGKLKTQMTRQGLLAQPVVAEAINALVLEPDGVEVESLKWVGINYFRRDERVRTDVFIKDGREYWAPVFEVDDYRIWGFTARILVDFLEAFSGFKLSKEHSAPERRYVL